MSELAHRLDIDISGALGIAALARAPGVSISNAALLIEQYARTKASEAVLDAVMKTGDRICAAIEAPLARKDPSHA